MNSFPVVTLKENTFFTQELVLDKQFLLLNPTCPFNDALKKALLEWDFKVVYSNGSIGVAATSAPSAADFEQVTIDDVGILEEKKSAKTDIGENVKKVLEEAHQDLRNNEKSRMSVVQTVYNEYMNYITAVYTHYATHKVLSYQELTETVNSAKTVSTSIDMSQEIALIEKISALYSSASIKVATLETDLFATQKIKDIQKQAVAYQRKVLKDMEELRKDVDAMEELVSAKYWPYPSYGEILFSVR